ncbi:MAG: Beta-lactamase 2 precursor [Candidatus Heimdallarchaeota archaeon AB_125]|nr:MAG: Beta-lactamase 2 precursor [Candidatus Heimdallarchaeota archaeon AB_125]
MKKKNIIKFTDSVWDHATSDTSSHTSFIKMDKFLIMVDTGMEPSTTKEIREFAEKETGMKFKYVIITHHHGDHTFGTNVFKDCDIISTRSTKKILEQKVAGDYKDKNIILPNVTFDVEYEIKDDFKTVKIIETHGHTQGSAFVYIPQESILLTGDLLFADMFPFAGDPSVNPYLWVDAFQKMIDLKPNIVIPGHGHIGSTAELIEGKKKISEMINVIEQLYKQGVAKKEILDSELLPDFTKNAYAGWLGRTIEAFYKIVEEKEKLLEQA